MWKRLIRYMIVNPLILLLVIPAVLIGTVGLIILEPVRLLDRWTLRE